MKKAISATLAGALAVGMVPAMALADDAQLETLTVEAIDAFEGGQVIAVTSAGGVDFAYDATAKAYKAALADDAVQYIVPTKVKLTDDEELAISGDDFKIAYYAADAQGAITSTVVAQPKGIGTYYAVITVVDGAYKGAELATKFVITGQQIAAELGVWNAVANEYYENKTASYEYNAAVQNIGFQVSGGKDLVEGTDYTVKYYVDGQDPDYVAGSTTAPKDAGSYFAVLTGLGKYAGTTQTIDFVVDKYVFNAADVVVDPVFVGSALPTAPTTVKNSAALAACFKLDYAGEGNVQGKGSWTATVKLVNPLDPNITYAADTVEVERYAAEATATYNDKAWPEAMTVVTAKNEKFDASLIEMFNGKTELTPVVSYYDADNKPFTGDINANPGKYTVVAEYYATDFTVAGKYTMSVTVTTDVIDGNTNGYFYYEGGIVSDKLEVVYDGDVVAITGKLMSNDKTPVEIASTVKFYDAKGKEIQQADVKDAGTYTAKIVNSAYTISNNELTIVVKPAAIAGIKVNNLVAVDGVMALEWPKTNVAGKDSVSAELKYFIDYDLDGKQDENGDEAWRNVAGSVNVKAVITLDGKVVTKMDQVGTYEVSLELADKNITNYIITAKPIKVVVAPDLRFVDVPLSHWAHNVIAKAVDDLSYMNGYAGTDFFGPDDNLTRAQAVCVLYNMAGGRKALQGFLGAAGFEGTTDADPSMDLPYSDTDNDAWYAEALYWATEAGVVNGDAGKDTYRPNAQITRQEAAAMLCNYAALRGSVAVADVDGVLAGFPDGSKVSGWAEGSVAWAADNGVIGNGGYLNPLAKITRAEMAAMAVNYQPANIA